MSAPIGLLGSVPVSQTHPIPTDIDWVSELARCAEVLEAVVADHSRLSVLDLDTRRRLLTAAGRVARPDPVSRRRLTRAFRRQERDHVRRRDTALLERTGMRMLRQHRSRASRI